MGFLDNAKGAAIRTKLKAEIVLLEREMAVRKRAFGIVLYDLMIAAEKSGSAQTNYHSKDSVMVPCFDAAKADIGEIQQRKDVKQTELDMLEMESANAKHKPMDTAAQKAKAAGKWISYAGTETKLSANLALIDREIKARKEVFGLDIFEFATTQLALEDQKMSNGGLKNAMASTKKIADSVISKVAGTASQTSVGETEIRACIEDAKVDIDRIQASKDKKMKEMVIA